MKLEIDIPEEAFNTLVKNRTISVINEYVNNWETQNVIRKELTVRFKPMLDKIIEEELSNIEDIKATLHTEMKRQINVKLQKLLKTL
jgi:hypothetical protein